MSVTSNDLSALCPILLYKLTAPTSVEQVECIQHGNMSAWNNDAENLQKHDHLAENKTLGNLIIF